MATYSAPVLGSVTLPDISAYTESEYYRQTVTELSSGTVVIDAISGGTAKHDYRLSWQYCTTDNKATIEGAWATVGSAYTADNFTTPTGGTVTVTRHPDQPGLTWEAIDSLGTLYWSGDLLLREV